MFIKVQGSRATKSRGLLNEVCGTNVRAGCKKRFGE